MIIIIQFKMKKNPNKEIIIKMTETHFNEKQNKYT